MKISARNKIAGTVVEVKEGATTAHITVDANGTKLVASITNEAVAELGLKPGQKVFAVIKSSDVMIGVE